MDLCWAGKMHEVLICIILTLFIIGKIASTYISAELQKCKYNSLQFSDEVNISVSKTPTTLIPLHTNYS